MPREKFEAPTSDKIRGALYCLVWYLSILLGFFFLYAPLLPLLFANRRLYRKATDVLFVAWEAFNVTLIQLVLGVDFRLSGDAFCANENALVVVNHRTRVDWNFLWGALFHAGIPTGAHNAKLVLKDDVKRIPGVGWTMQLARFVYISRDWKRDESRMGLMVDHLASAAEPFQLLLFPEGTNLTAETKRRSDAFAAANNLASYGHVLHPRTTGFSCLARRMMDRGKLDAVYDVTVAYADDRVAENERAISEGNFPKEIRFAIRRFGTSDVPTTLIGLEKWLQEVWREKERRLKLFFEDDDPTAALGPSKPSRVLPLQYVALAAWAAFIHLSLFYALFTSHGLLWVASVSIGMFAVSKFSNGLQEIEAKLDKLGNVKGLFSLLWKSKHE